MTRTAGRLAILLAALGLAGLGHPAAAQTPSTHERLGRDLLKELIETDTTHASGSTTIAADRLAARFIAAGFPKTDLVVVRGTSKAAETRGNLVVRYRGTGARKPVLFFAHLDVVEARREDWSLDPFALTEKDGYFYGRGTIDVKGGAATLAAAFLRLRQESFVPDRDLILALTADEEGGDDNGIEWILANRRELIDAAYAMNVDTGGGEILAGKLAVLDVQASEKVFASFTLTTKNSGGHSSMPPKDNAIYRLAAGLQRLATFEFPVQLTDVTRAYFEKMAPLSGADRADMAAVARTTPDALAAARLSAKSAFHNALLRTTCVATLLQAGHAENALPQTARATVNCRIIPGADAGAVQPTLVRVLGDPEIAVAPIKPAEPSPPSPLAPEPLSAIESAARATWGASPAVPIAPFMDTGATDGRLLRMAGIPVYGTTGIAYDPDDYRAHGKDERILVKSFDEGVVFAYQLAKTIGTPATVAGASDAAGKAPVLRVRSDGRLDVSTPPSGTVIRYTLDGTAPTRDSGEWLAPVEAPPGYTVKATAFTAGGSPVGDVATWSAPAATTRSSSTLVPVTQNRDWRVYDWTARHTAATALLKTRQPEIVMLGDSITHFWGGEPVGGRRTGAQEWDRFFAGRSVVNLGYGWDRTENVLWRLTHGEFDGIRPKVVVLMVGTNNVSFNTPDEIAAGIDAICAEVHRRSPATKILLLGIFPRGAKPDATRATVTGINQRIARLDGRNGVTFLDIGEKFLAADGSISVDVMYDYLHPTAKGYAIWSAAMAPTLERLLE